MTTTANTTNAFPAGPLRPNLVADPALPESERTLSRWFNTAAFRILPRDFRGLTAFGFARTPLIKTDLTIENVPVGDRGFRLDVHVETYNLLNRVNFNTPGSTLGAATSA